MKIESIGEVCLLTHNVPRLADFYRNLLGLEPGGDASDETHQFILTEGTALTVMRDDGPRTGAAYTGQSAALAFTVPDMDAAYRRVTALGAPIIEPPTVRPWGAVNMSFRDPDGSAVYFRSFPKEEQ